MTGFETVAQLIEPWLWAGLLVFLRVGAVAALAPAFGEQGVPVRIRLAAAMAFTLAVLPAVDGITATPPDLPAGLGMALAEVMAGLLFGILVRLFVLALQTAGTIAAQSMSLAQILGAGAAAEPAPAIGHLFVIGGLALAAMSGLHVQLALYLIDSYRLIPAGTFPRAETMIGAGLQGTGQTFGLAFSLALPFVIGALLYNLVLGVINRAMPQLMVTFVGAPVLTAGSLALLALAAPGLIGLWQSALAGFLAAPFAATP